MAGINLNAINFQKWIEEHRDVLKPPVCNAIVWEDTDFMVMVVGGPNQRKDFHINPTEEFFHQVEGDMILRIKDGSETKEIRINEGDIYLLPPNIPHSPQRFENTVGLVIERRRQEGDHDHLRWYCDNCGEILHDPHFHLTNLAKQIRPVIEEFYASEELRTCRSCSSVMVVD